MAGWSLLAVILNLPEFKEFADSSKHRARVPNLQKIRVILVPTCRDGYLFARRFEA